MRSTAATQFQRSTDARVSARLRLVACRALRSRRSPPAGFAMGRFACAMSSVVGEQPGRQIFLEDRRESIGERSELIWLLQYVEPVRTADVLAVPGGQQVRQLGKAAADLPRQLEP